MNKREQEWFSEAEALLRIALGREPYQALSTAEGADPGGR